MRLDIKIVDTDNGYVVWIRESEIDKGLHLVFHDTSDVLKLIEALLGGRFVQVREELGVRMQVESQQGF